MEGTGRAQVKIKSCPRNQNPTIQYLSHNSQKNTIQRLNSYDQTGKILDLTKLLRVSVEELFVFLLRVDLSNLHDL